MDLRLAVVSSLCASLGSLGCAATIHSAAKQAAPAAVEGTVKAAHDPATRARLADVLEDPRLRQASTELSQAVAEGVLDALSNRGRQAKMLESSDAFVEHMSHTLALSIRRDLGPAIGDVAALSVERSLDAATEARIQALARGAAHQAALGVQDAIAESTAQQKAGKAPPGAVLAAAGVGGDSLILALRGVGWALVVAGALVALTVILWAVRRLARPKHDDDVPHGTRLNAH